MSSILSDGLYAWLGPLAESLTDEQAEHITEASRLIDAAYPHEDFAMERQAALTAVVQQLVGDTTPDEARQALDEARRAERQARIHATWTAVAMSLSGQPDATSAAAVGINRMSLLEALGKRPRRRRA